MTSRFRLQPDYDYTESDDWLTNWFVCVRNKLVVLMECLLNPSCIALSKVWIISSLFMRWNVQHIIMCVLKKISRNLTLLRPWNQTPRFDNIFDNVYHLSYHIITVISYLLSSSWQMLLVIRCISFVINHNRFNVLISDFIITIPDNHIDIDLVKSHFTFRLFAAVCRVFTQILEI